METTEAVCLIVGLVAAFLSVRNRRRVVNLEEMALELTLEISKVRNENQHLKNRMHIQKTRMKNVETTAASWRGALEVCAREHFNLSDILHDLKEKAQGSDDPEG